MLDFSESCNNGGVRHHNSSLENRSITMSFSLGFIFFALGLVVVWGGLAVVVVRFVKRRFGPNSTWAEDRQNARQEKLEKLQRECEEFIGQVSPRIGIPKSLMQAHRISWGNAVGAGTMLSLSAGGMLVMPLLLMKAPPLLTVGLCTSVSILAGCAIVAVYSRSSKRRKHILEHGLLVSEAMVEHKRTLPNAEGSAQKQSVSFEFEFDGETRTATTKINDPYPDFTERYCDGDLPVKLLVDPLNPDTVLWVEGAVFASC